MSNQPAYLTAVNIRCIGGCSQVVKSNGVSVMTHTVLHHQYSPGETALICRKCFNDWNKMHALTCESGNWTIGETVEVERPAAEYPTPLRRALSETFTKQTETI